MDFRLFHKFLHGGGDRLAEPWKPPVGPGWHPAIYKALRQIDELVVPGETDFKIGQIKEKFGTLRFYVDVDGPPSIVEKIRGIAKQAERETENTCEECGAAGKTAEWRDGWAQTLCPDHAADVIDRTTNPLPKFPAWRLERVGRAFKLVTADGQVPTFDATRTYSLELVGKIDAIERDLEASERNSAEWKALLKDLTAKRHELEELTRAWFLARGDGDLDAAVQAHQAAGKLAR